MLFYIDYLDHITSSSTPFAELEKRLRFDLLIYASDTLCMSVPACIKLRDTTELLIHLDHFWRNKKILLQLDKKHKGVPGNYFSNRKAVLSKGMPEEKLVNHFEYIAYEDKRTDNFFGVYLSEMLSAPASEIYLGKEKDTDGLFRNETVSLLQKHYDPVCKSLDSNSRVRFTGIVNKIQSYALDESILFQRVVIEENIISEHNPSNVELQVITTLLDRAFALANADTSNAVPLSLVLNQLNGKWLMRLLSKSYKFLYDLISALNWTDVFSLSQDKDWRNFIGYINAYIGVIQEPNQKKHSTITRRHISICGELRMIYVKSIASPLLRTQPPAPDTTPNGRLRMRASLHGAAPSVRMWIRRSWLP